MPPAPLILVGAVLAVDVVGAGSADARRTRTQAAAVPVRCARTCMRFPLVDVSVDLAPRLLGARRADLTGECQRREFCEAVVR